MLAIVSRPKSLCPQRAYAIVARQGPGRLVAGTPGCFISRSRPATSPRSTASTARMTWSSTPTPLPGVGDVTRGRNENPQNTAVPGFIPLLRLLSN